MKFDLLTWIGIILFIIIMYKIITYIIRKIRLGTLTGSYVHYKTSRGNIFEVERNINGKKLYSEATEKEVKVLKYYKLLN